MSAPEIPFNAARLLANLRLAGSLHPSQRVVVLSLLPEAERYLLTAADNVSDPVVAYMLLSRLRQIAPDIVAEASAALDAEDAEAELHS